MSVANKLLQAAAGNAGEAVYVDDLFSTYIDYSESWGPHTATTGLDMSGEGGMVWTRKREGSNHSLYDTERGATKHLSPDQTSAEATVSLGLTAFTSTGFTFDTSHAEGPTNSRVWWSFRKQPGFFDVVTYTGDGTTNRAISHNVGAEVGMMIVKRLDSTQDWRVYHRSLDSVKPADYRLFLNSTSARLSGNSEFGTGDGTPPTTTEFTVHGNLNLNGSTYVCYLFAHDAQDFGEDSDEAIIKCGSYSNSGSAWSVDLGFEPQFLLRKLSSGIGSWQLTDTMRGLLADGNARLIKLDANAENNASGININPTGFNGDGTGDTGTWIYMAIARPHKPAEEFAATDLFAIDTQGGTSPTPPAYVSGFPVDMELHKNVTGNGDWRNGARLMQGKYLATNSTASEGTDASMTAFDYQNGFRDSTSTGSSKYAWMWRRAKGYFDVVTYVGTGANRTVSHNLGVAPELMIIKDRDSTNHWAIYNSISGATKYNHFNTAAPATSSTYFNDTEPTSSVFTVGTQSRTNRSTGNFIAYLFASVDGISKIGSFTKASGTDYDVDCGFSSGAKLVIIKRIDSTSQWYMWDSDRGINAGTEPYVGLNTNAAQTTNANIIDPLSSGFTAVGGLTAGDYIFYAIA